MVPFAYYVAELPKPIADDVFTITLNTSLDSKFTYTLSYNDILPSDIILDNGKSSLSSRTVYDLNDSSKYVEVQYAVVYPSEDFYTTKGYSDWAKANLPVFQGYHFSGYPKLGEIVVESISSGFEKKGYTEDESERLFGSVTGGYSPYFNLFGTREGEFLNYVPSEFIPDDYTKPIFGFHQIDNTDVFFLYNLGEQLVNFSSMAASVLNFEIGGFSLISLLLSGGFLLYMSWVVIKWFIPL